ncbi:hypothetical protein, partial [Streptococcus pneumoniae]|uniref:hypothetical protein n=1 Tax=Streptococcus pneumoniae TaxID=1313 RepID=UPI0018B08164
RGAMSQGMIIPLEDVVAELEDQCIDGGGWDKEDKDFEVGADLTGLLGVTKYEPPESHGTPHASFGKKTGGIRQVNPHFHKYTDIENIKNYHT